MLAIVLNIYPNQTLKFVGWHHNYDKVPVIVIMILCGRFTVFDCLKNTYDLSCNDGVAAVVSYLAQIHKMSHSFYFSLSRHSSMSHTEFCLKFLLNLRPTEGQLNIPPKLTPHIHVPLSVRYFQS